MGILSYISKKLGSAPALPPGVPQDYPLVRAARSMEDLLQAGFGPANVLILPRRPAADFNALAAALGKRLDKLDSIPGSAAREIPAPRLSALLPALPESAREAAGAILRDMDAITADARWNWHSRLRVIPPGGYNAEILAFHTDNGSGDEGDDMGRILCAYNHAATPLLRNDRARKVAPGHYLTRGAAPFTAGLGAIVRMAFARENHPVPGAIHGGVNAPAGGPPRLLLVADVLHRMHGGPA